MFRAAVGEIFVGLVVNVIDAARAADLFDLAQRRFAVNCARRVVRRDSHYGARLVGDRLGYQIGAKLIIFVGLRKDGAAIGPRDRHLVADGIWSLHNYLVARVG